MRGNRSLTSKAARGGLSIVLATVLGTALGHPAVAGSHFARDSPDLAVVDMTWLLPPPEPTEDSSRFVVNDTQIVSSLILGASEVWAIEGRPLPEAPDNADQFYCESYTDQPCRNRELGVRAHLPPCSESPSPQCIEGVTFTRNGQDFPAEFVRYLNFSGPLRLDEMGPSPNGPVVLEMHPIVDLPADETRGLPAGARVGLWKVPGLIDAKGRFIAVDLGMGLNVSAQGQTRVYEFGAGVTPVWAESRPSTAAPALVSVRDPNGHRGVGGSGMDGWYEDCAYRDVDFCFRRTAFPESAIVTVTAKVSSKVTGWLHGRLVNPVIDVERVNASINRLTVSGIPAITPATQRSIPNRLLPAQWAMPREAWFTGEGIWHPGTVLSATSPHQFKWFKGILPWLGDRADAALPSWSFRAVAGVTAGSSRCLKSTSELVGLVSTNAMMYDGGPPQFVGDKLQYGVAGQHLDPAGDVVRGNYSLVMKSTVARCLYGFSQAPISAEISVVSEDGKEQVVTTSMSESDGWLKLTAENFTFSSPTIEMKLMGQEKTSTLVCLKSKKKIKGPKKVVVKGTATKPPRCPKGYRAA